MKAINTFFCGVYETWTTPGNFSYFHLELNAVDRCICSCSTFLEPLAYRTDQDNREFRLQNINSFFARRRPRRRRRRRCLSSLKTGTRRIMRQDELRYAS